jgi:hypothetical protein
VNRQKKGPKKEEEGEQKTGEQKKPKEKENP